MWVFGAVVFAATAVMIAILGIALIRDRAFIAVTNDAGADRADLAPALLAQLRGQARDPRSPERSSPENGTNVPDVAPDRVR